MSILALRPIAGALVDKVTVIDFGSNPNFTVEEYLALRSASVTNPISKGSMVRDEIDLIVAKEGQLQEANVHALNVDTLDKIRALDDTDNAVDTWQAKTAANGQLDGTLATQLKGIDVATFAAVEKVPAQNQALLIAETSVIDTVTNIVGTKTGSSNPLAKLGKSDVAATDATVNDAVQFVDQNSPLGSLAGSFRLAENNSNELDLVKIGLANNSNGTAGDKPLAVNEAKAVLLAANSNKLASSDLSISDTADNIESAAQESFISTVGSVHATGATIAQAGEFIDTGYVNSITLKTSAFQDLRVREAEIVTNDKIVSTVSSYEIKDSLANITVASPSLLANSNGYEVATDISGVLDIDEALAWKSSDTYASDIAKSTQFSIQDTADKILNASSDPEARIVMGDATSVKAAGGVVSVSGSNSLQGLSFFDADISSYAIEDTASALIASSTSKALENLDVAGVASIKLVDASNPSANATDGASLNAIKAGLTDDGTTMTFNVKDTAANLAAKAANLDEANVVTIGDSASTEVNVANAVLLNGIPNYDNKGAYTIKDTADAVSKSSVEILGDAVSVTLSDVANAAQGALINGLDKGESTTDITFNVEDSATNLAAKAANLDVAEKVSVGSAGDNEVSVADAGLLNGIANYDHQGGYTIKDTADAVSKSSVAILGDADSVTLSDVANAAQGALINGFDKGEDSTDITFNVKDTAANLAANAANLDVANAVTIGDSASTEVNVANAVLLNGIANYDKQGAYTIKDTADAVSKSSVAILGDAVSSPCPMLRMQLRARSSMG